MNISKREKVLIVIALIFAVFCMYFFFYLKPHTEAMEELNKKIADCDTNLKASQQMQDSNAKLEKKISEDMVVIERLSGAIAKGNDQPPLLVFLEETVKPHATKGTFLFGNVTQSGYLFISPVTITLTGDYKGVKNILSAFAGEQHFVKVTGLSIFSDIREVSLDEREDAQNERSSPKEQTAESLEIKIDIEVYSIAGDIPPGTEYTFAKDYRFGTDIFG